MARRRVALFGSGLARGRCRRSLAVLLAMTVAISLAPVWNLPAVADPGAASVPAGASRSAPRQASGTAAGRGHLVSTASTSAAAGKAPADVKLPPGASAVGPEV